MANGPSGRRLVGSQSSRKKKISIIGNGSGGGGINNNNIKVEFTMHEINVCEFGIMQPPTSDLNA